MMQKKKQKDKNVLCLDLEPEPVRSSKCQT